MENISALCWRTSSAMVSVSWGCPTGGIPVFGGLSGVEVMLSSLYVYDIVWRHFHKFSYIFLLSREANNISFIFYPYQVCLANLWSLALGESSMRTTWFALRTCPLSPPMEMFWSESWTLRSNLGWMSLSVAQMAVASHPSSEFWERWGVGMTQFQNALISFSLPCFALCFHLICVFLYLSGLDVVVISFRRRICYPRSI